MSEQNLFSDFLSDEDKSLKGAGASLKFGLNTGKLEKFEFNPNSGKDDAPANAIDIVIKIGEREVKQKIFETVKVFGKDGEITDKESPEYKKAYTDDVKLKKGLLTHYMKIFLPEDIIAAKLKEVTIKNFVDLFKFAQSAVEAGIKKAGNNLVDVFLQYQWSINPGQTMTYLEIPKNLKDGGFICKAIEPVGEWKEVTDNEGLHYEDESGNIHKFKRDRNYLKTPKAIQQKSIEDPYFLQLPITIPSTSTSSTTTSTSTSSTTTW